MTAIATTASQSTVLPGWLEAALCSASRRRVTNSSRGIPMINTRKLFLLALLSVGCADSPTEPVYHIPAPDVGSIALTVNVSGDPKLLQSTFSVRFNDFQWSNIQPNEPVRVPLKQGDYSVRLSPLSSREWCLALDPTALNARVEAGKSKPVFFAVDCPPLVGTAIVHLAVAASGVKVPPEFVVHLNRVIGPSFTLTATVRANDSADVSVPVGVYNISVVTEANCAPPATSSFAAAIAAAIAGAFRPLYIPLYMMRAGDTLRTSFSVYCRAAP
jgi:hypothetical protein